MSWNWEIKKGVKNLHHTATEFYNLEINTQPVAKMFKAFYVPSKLPVTAKKERRFARHTETPFAFAQT
jgi:hypothetical protein